MIIEGVNSKGEIFRPSDWALRLSSIGAEYGDSHRLHISPLLHPDMKNVTTRLVVEPELHLLKPEVYQHVISFVEANDLT